MTGDGDGALGGAQTSTRWDFLGKNHQAFLGMKAILPHASPNLGLA